MRRLVILSALWLLALSLSSAKPHARLWKTAKVLDSSTSSETRVSHASISGADTTLTDTSTDVHRSTEVYHTTIQTNQLLLVGEDYAYVVEDSRQRSDNLGRALLTDRLVNRHHGCRFVVGEDVKYSQEKASLYVLDADGKECKVGIVRQEKRQGKG